MTTVAVLALLVLAVALVSRSRKLSLLAGILGVALGYYLADTGLVDIARQELADALSFAARHAARLVPGIAP